MSPGDEVIQGLEPRHCAFSSTAKKKKSLNYFPHAEFILAKQPRHLYKQLENAIF